MGFPSPDPRLFGVAQQLADERGEHATETGSQEELAAERLGPGTSTRRGRLATLRVRLSRALARVSARRR